LVEIFTFISSHGLVSAVKIFANSEMTGFMTLPMWHGVTHKQISSKKIIKK